MNWLTPLRSLDEEAWKTFLDFMCDRKQFLLEKLAFESDPEKIRLLQGEIRGIRNMVEWCSKETNTNGPIQQEIARRFKPTHR